MTNKKEPIVIKQHKINEQLLDQKDSAATRDALNKEATLIQKTIEEEVLLREALKLNLIENDSYFRKQLIQRMQLFIEKQIEVDSQISEEDLKNWWRDHQDRYSTPVRVDVYHYFINQDKRGEIDFRSKQLSRECYSPSLAYKLGDPYPKGYYFRDYSLSEIKSHLKLDDVRQINLSRQREWQGPVTSRDGYHWFYIASIQEVRKLNFEESIESVKQDFLEHKYKKAKTTRINKLISNYEIIYEE